MIIQTFPSGPFETNTYVVACPETNKAAIIDPAPNSADAIIAHLAENSFQPKMILITHSHWDHIGDTAQLKARFQTPVYVHALDVSNLQEPGSDGLPGGTRIEGVLPDKFLSEGDIINLGKVTFEVIHTPGHTPGGICIYCKEERILFSGDTLFKGSIGNLSLPTSDSKQMWASLAKLVELPPETKVYPGHGSPTTIGEEPWLTRAKEIFGT
ncbi:MAG: MBL fold metallo-hydrolase [Waddliaceae bacterium]